MRYLFRHLLLISLFVGHMPGCTTLGTEPEIRKVGRHSFKPGSPAGDRALVIEILRINHLKDSLFDSVADVGDDHRVHRLNFRNRGIDTLPERIGELAELESIDFSGNNLRVLPEGITVIQPFYYQTQSYGPCGGTGCSYTYKVGSVNVDGNFLCSVSVGIGSWLDNGYLSGPGGYSRDWRSTQRCTVGTVP